MSALRAAIALVAQLGIAATAAGQQADSGEPDPLDAPAVASSGPVAPLPPDGPSEVAGLGVMSCAAVNQRFTINFRYYQSIGMDAETAYWTSFQGMLHWALGYMSHRNLVLAQADAAVVDLQPLGFDHAHQLEFLRDWCVQNPALTFNDAVEALFAQLAFPRQGPRGQ
ncbi:MAG: hypothetical protein R3F55_21925 [Alphaproteobacteria bacterium]